MRKHLKNGFPGLSAPGAEKVEKGSKKSPKCFFFFCSSELFAMPCPSFPCSFGKRQGKPQKKTRIIYPSRSPKIAGKEGENAQNNEEFLAREKKNKEFQKNKERTGWGRSNLVDPTGSPKIR